MAITRVPYLVQPGYNEVVVTDDANDTLTVASTVPTPASTVTLRHVITQGGASFDLKGYVSNLFYDHREPVVTTWSAPWVYKDMRLMALYKIGDDPVTHEVINAVKQPGETLDLINEAAHPVLSYRAKHLERRTVIPCYDGYPVGCSFLWRKVYQDLDADAFIVLIVVTAGTSYQFPVTGKGIINWGDGTMDEAYASEYRTHVYSESGGKRIVYKPLDKSSIHDTRYNTTDEEEPELGNYRRGLAFIERFSPSMYYASFGGCYNLVGVRSPWTADSVESCDYMFAGCRTLVDFPDNFFGSVVVASSWSFRYAFIGCTNLAAIPIGLFNKATRIRSLKGCFSGCTGLLSIRSGLIPAQMGGYMNVDCSEMFYRCTGLTSIPADLFANLGAGVSTFSGAFALCDNLSGVPAALFQTNTGARDFSHVFERCTALIMGSAHTNFFKMCAAATDMSYAFSHCTSLTGIPPGFFDANTDIITFAYVFNGCGGIVLMPPGLFKYNTKAANFTYAFGGCSLSAIPPDTFANNPGATTVNGCFLSTKITGIPAGLFATSPEIADFSQCFANTLITSVPADLFTYTKVSSVSTHRCFHMCDLLTDISGLVLTAGITDATWMFMLCHNLTAIPAGIFGPYAGSSVKPDFTAMFYETGITAIPADLFQPFAGNAETPVLDNIFALCAGITSIPDGLLAPLTEATNELVGMFGGTGITAIDTQLFRYNTKLTDASGIFANTAITVVNSSLFDYCPNLTRAVATFAQTKLITLPELMFASCPYLYDVERCFSIEPDYSLTAGLTPRSPGGRLWERSNPGVVPPMQGYACFRGRIRIPEYNEIPDSWK